MGHDQTMACFLYSHSIKPICPSIKLGKKGRQTGMVNLDALFQEEVWASSSMKLYLGFRDKSS